MMATETPSNPTASDGHGDCFERCEGHADAVNRAEVVRVRTEKALMRIEYAAAFRMDVNSERVHAGVETLYAIGLRPAMPVVGVL